MLTALIVDDHVAVRKGLKQILIEEFKEVLCGEAGDAGEALRMAAKRGWDIVILDIGMPGRSGLHVLKEIRRIRPRSRVLVLTVFADAQYVTRAMRLGASGYITKDRARPDLVIAIQKLLAGASYVSVPETESRVLHETLSSREFKVMLELAAGKRVTDVAHEMNLSVKTISTYKRRILNKMHLNVSADLTRYALEQGLL